MGGQDSSRSLTTGKSATARRFRSAHEIELDAEARAQQLTDQTAAELEELARSMHAITHTMCQVMEKIAKTTDGASMSVKQAATTMEGTAEKMRETAVAWHKAANDLRLQLAGRFRRLLGVAVLSAVVGSASAGLLLRCLPESSSMPPPQITIDTGWLATEIINRWQLYQRQGATGNGSRESR